MKEKIKLRVLLSKIGLDGHDRGLGNVAYALRDAGFEVIYLGRHQFPEQIAEVALQEAADVVGISSLADAHMTLMALLMDALKKKGIQVPVVLGGFIQPEDEDYLKEIGVAKIFSTGTPLGDIVKYFKQVRENYKEET
jgi:methylmalonyl-CoA mutase C-terminal domain/subunit